MMTVSDFLFEVRRVARLAHGLLWLLWGVVTATGLAIALSHPEANKSSEHWWFTAPAIVAGLMLWAATEIVSGQTRELSRVIAAEERSLYELEAIELWFREANYMLGYFAIVVGTAIGLGAWKGGMSFLSHWSIPTAGGLAALLWLMLTSSLVWVSGSLRNLNLETRAELTKKGVELEPRRERLEFRVPTC